MQKTFKAILVNLPMNHYITSSELGIKALISEKTVRNHIHELSDYLKKHGAYIETKHGQGYKLVITDSKKFEQIALENTDHQYISPENSEMRCAYLINYLYQHDDSFAFEDILQCLYISDITLQNDIFRLKKILGWYELKLVSKQYIYYLEGKEIYKRQLYINYALLNDEKNNKYRDEISKILVDTISAYNLSIPEISIDNIIQYLLITFNRISKGYHLQKEEIESIDNDEAKKLSVEIASSLCQQFSNKSGLQISDLESQMLMTCLFANRINNLNINGMNNVVVSDELYDLVQELLLFIKATMKINLTKNLTLVMNLAVHLIALNVRMKYHILVKNPMKEEIKKRYSFGYTIADQCKQILEKKYNSLLSDDEISNLGLIFEFSCRNENKNKKNILIVCASGKISAELLAYQYREKFGNYLDTIETCNGNDLIGKDLSHIDYIITTTPIRMSVPVPIIETKLLLSDSDEEQLKKIFLVSKLNMITNYYRRDLFFTNVSGKNKEEAIRNICSLISKNENISAEFAEAVIKRESFGSTDFGELIALAHPYGLVTSKSFAAVAILKDNVDWGNHKIKIVLLISIADGKDDFLEEFYRKTSKFMLNPEKAKKLISDPTYERFIALLEE